MSQHLLTVVDSTGAPQNLTAGFDRRLQRFFLTVYDQRRPAPDSDQVVPAHLAGLRAYDSDEADVELLSVADVERMLAELDIPCDPDFHPGLNEQLPALLAELATEQGNDHPGLARKIKDWDAVGA